MVRRISDSLGVRLSDANRRTCETLFRHPAPEDLAWGDVRALIGALAEVQAGRKGLFKATRRGVMATFRAGRDNQALSADELLEVRSFIERSSEGVSMPVVAEDARLLVAIDALGARIYQLELRAGLPVRLAPFHGNGYSAELRATHARPDGKPEPVSLRFYTEVARCLRGAAEILLVACGEGGAEALQALRLELARSHAEVARCVVDARVLEGRGPREPRLLAGAREFYAGRGE